MSIYNKYVNCKKAEQLYITSVLTILYLFLTDEMTTPTLNPVFKTVIITCAVVLSFLMSLVLIWQTSKSIKVEQRKRTGKRKEDIARQKRVISVDARSIQWSQNLSRRTGRVSSAAVGSPIAELSENKASSNYYEKIDEKVIEFPQQIEMAKRSAITRQNKIVIETNFARPTELKKEIETERQTNIINKPKRRHKKKIRKDEKD